ncbi:hypothetical protein CGRA01v4_02261 [Colletotrichum graminicola]|nr:hypothetical protein CGRA01v4_02261 [Colletotrichum graminicola]
MLSGLRSFKWASPVAWIHVSHAHLRIQLRLGPLVHWKHVTTHCPNSRQCLRAGQLSRVFTTPLIASLHCQVDLASLQPCASYRVANNIVNQLPISDSATRTPKTSLLCPPHCAIRPLLPPFASSHPFIWFPHQP